MLLFHFCPPLCFCMARDPFSNHNCQSFLISLFCTQLSALFGINWHALSQSERRNFCMYIITWEILRIPGNFATPARILGNHFLRVKSGMRDKWHFWTDDTLGTWSNRSVPTYHFLLAFWNAFSIKIVNSIMNQKPSYWKSRFTHACNRFLIRGGVIVMWLARRTFDLKVKPRLEPGVVRHIVQVPYTKN